MERRLAAVFAADIVGYSRLMAADESGTHRRVKTLFDQVVRTGVNEHGGRIVKVMGDGVLAEFPSVVEAVHSAVAIQQAIAAAEADKTDDRRIRLRIGINLGDIIFDGDDIHGDGVNIAARLEGLAEPGGICISGPAFETIDGKIDVEFEDLGPQILKHIGRPVRVHRVIMTGREAWASSPSGAGSSLDNRPSIAVLPFTNMSGDPEQEFFADGIAEDITTALSRFRELTVIARNTSFTFKGQAVNVRDVARSLGVKYVLEGSVRQAGNRVRVTVQLIDATVDRHIWAERFDRELDDIFSVQDEITAGTVASVAPQTQYAEMASAYSKAEIDLTGWERVMRARWHLDKYTRGDTETAIALLKTAIAAAPGLSQAYSTLAVCHVYKMLNAWCEDPMQETATAGEAARRALALDANDANALAVMGLAALFERRFEECTDLLEQAVARNPNLATAYGFMATAYGCLGKCERAIDSFDRAIMLSPKDPTRVFWYAGKGIGLYIDGRYEEAVRNARIIRRVDATYGAGHRQLAASLAMLGRQAEAEAAMQELLAIMPNLTVAKVAKMIPIRAAADQDRWLEGLRRAGLPE